MKKTLFPILVMTLCSITTVSAEKLTLCQAFIKLGEQCDDFSTWKSSEISGLYGKFYSSMEVEGALSSCIKESVGDRSFLADFGSFDSENLAVEKVESLKNELLTCYSILKFGDTKGNFGKNLSYIIQYSNEGFRFYKACFIINKSGQSWDVTFEFPQSKKDDFIGTITKPYTDYVRIQGAADQNDFSQGVQRLLVEARTGFAAVKGEKLNNSAMFDQYKATFMPLGENCYIEDRGMGIVFYEIPILQDQTLETIQNQIETVLKNIQKTFGPEYGFAVSPDGMSVSFALADRPYNVAAILYVEKIMDGYNMNLSIKAEQKPID